MSSSSVRADAGRVAKVNHKNISDKTLETNEKNNIITLSDDFDIIFNLCHFLFL